MPGSGGPDLRRRVRSDPRTGRTGTGLGVRQPERVALEVIPLQGLNLAQATPVQDQEADGGEAGDSRCEVDHQGRKVGEAELPPEIENRLVEPA